MSQEIMRWPRCARDRPEVCAKWLGYAQDKSEVSEVCPRWLSSALDGYEAPKAVTRKLSCVYGARDMF
jgi:hypothetical protein